MVGVGGLVRATDTPHPTAVKNPHVTFDPQNLTTDSLLLTGSLTNNMHSWLAPICMPYVFYINTVFLQ